MADMWESLSSALTDVPRLDGARCIGLHEWFDRHDQSDEYALSDEAAALKICAECPALRACAEWLDSVRPSRRPRGVVAGRVVK